VVDDEKLAAITAALGLDDRDTHDPNPNLAPRSPPLESSSSRPRKFARKQSSGSGSGSGPGFGPGPNGHAALPAPYGADNVLSQSKMDLNLDANYRVIPKPGPRPASAPLLASGPSTAGSERTQHQPPVVNHNGNPNPGNAGQDEWAWTKQQNQGGGIKVSNAG
jgi:hypothetical protein